MTMEVILVRHASAEVRDTARWPDDRKRPLSPHGRNKFTKAAAGLGRWLPKVDAVFTSPLTRARQTAKMLQDIAGWPQAEVSAALVPYRSPAPVFALLNEHPARRVVLIGHEPGLGRFLAACLCGPAARPVAEFRKGGVTVLEFTAEPQAGKATLLAFVPPRVLRRMGRK